ncbi:MAG: NUDIX hydrolase [Rhodobacteraceae bacterium]|nr:NUDIX hydrolase [Paracoccaceae bacterium]
MTMQRATVPPAGRADLPEGRTRTQVAALCWRADAGRVEVLLITSRETGRWVLPKGWARPGAEPHLEAAREAWEEAGVRGTASAECIGLYSYQKVLTPEAGVPCMVAVYPLQVATLAKDYPEKGQRRLKWFPPQRAAGKVSEPELKALLASFRPDRDLPLVPR